LTQFPKVGGLAAHLRVLNALHQGHAVAVQQDLAGELLVETVLLAADGVEQPSEVGQRSVPLDDTVSNQAELGVVRQLALFRLARTAVSLTLEELYPD